MIEVNRLAIPTTSGQFVWVFCQRGVVTPRRVFAYLEGPDQDVTVTHGWLRSILNAALTLDESYMPAWCESRADLRYLGCMGSPLAQIVKTWKRHIVHDLFGLRLRPVQLPTPPAPVGSDAALAAERMEIYPEEEPTTEIPVLDVGAIMDAHERLKTESIDLLAEIRKLQAWNSQWQDLHKRQAAENRKLQQQCKAMSDRCSHLEAERRRFLHHLEPVMALLKG